MAEQFQDLSPVRRIPSFTDVGHFALAVAFCGSGQWNLPVPRSVSFLTHLFILLSVLWCALYARMYGAFKKDFIYLFLERGEGKEKERERNTDWLPLARPQLGTWPTTQACALTGN